METRLFVLDNILINCGLVQGNTFVSHIDRQDQMVTAGTEPQGPDPGEP